MAARRLRLHGFVRNLSDGRSVEVVAEGRRSCLDSLLSELRAGPPGAYVERVETSWGEAADGYGDFIVR